MTSSNSLSCPLSGACGGCPCREQPEAEYRQRKIARIEAILSEINQEKITYGTPVFIGDGTRRRAVMAFRCQKGQVTLGFNAARSNEVLDCTDCLLLTPAIRIALPKLKELLTAL